MRNKTFYMISACASPDETWCQMMIESFRNYLGCYDESVKEGGYVFGLDTTDAGTVKTRDSVQKAYEMGKAI